MSLSPDNVIDAGAPAAGDQTKPRPGRNRRPLLWKEWMEHRWRFLLGAVTLATLLGGMLRAQVVPHHEAGIAIFWPVGTLLVIFLAMGPVSTERSAGTWEFLVAQPVSRGRVLMAKWLVGLLELWGMLALGCVVGVLAMWSRGFYGRSIWWRDYGHNHPMNAGEWLTFINGHPALWLTTLAVVAAVVLSCWFTFLFFVLTRARNEFTAALGGILLTVAAMAWLPQLYFDELRFAAMPNPFADFFLLSKPQDMAKLIYVMPIQILLWMVVPIVVMWKRTGRPAHE